MTPYIAGLLNSAAQKYGLDPALLSRVAMTESGGNPDAVSPAGAVGVMQLMPATAKGLGVDPRDPAQNVDGGAHYLRQQLDRFGSPELALAAYNAGPGRVAKAGGVPNIPETQAYVGKVMGTGGDIFGGSGSERLMGGSGADIFGMDAPKAQQGGSGADIFADAPAQAPKMDKAAPFPSAASVKALGRPSVANDVKNTIAPSLEQGVSSVLGMFGDLRDLPGKVNNAAVDFLVSHGLADPQAGAAVKAAVSGAQRAVAGGPVGLGNPLAAGLPNSAQVNAARQAVVGKDYVPQTVAGQYTRTVGQFAPAVVVPGSIPQRAANVVVPALASETAGQATKGTPYEDAARFAGGLVGGAFAPGLVDRIGAIPQRAQAAAAFKPQARVADAIKTAAQRDSMDPADIVAAARANPAAPAFHAGGENLTGLAEVAAQSPGPARQQLLSAIRQHQGTVPDQIKGDISSALGGKGDYFASLDSLMEQRKAAALPYRDAAFSQPLDPVKYQQEVAPIMSRVPQSALNFAAKLAELDGRDPNEVGLITQSMPGGGSIDVRVQNPTMETLHYVKKGLDQDLNQFRDGLGRLNLEGQPMAAGVSNVRGALGRSMREISPDYDKFMRTWGDESDHVEALRLGRDVFASTPEMSAEQLAQHVRAMDPVSHDLYAKGVGEALIAQVRSLKGGVGTMRQLLRSEEYRDRVRLAFPDQKSYDDFIAAATKRVEEQNRNNQVIGNSRTFGRAAAAEDLKSQPPNAADIAAAGLDLATGNVRALTGKSLKLALKTLPRRDRSIIGDPTTNAILGNALSSPDALEQLLAAQRPSRFGGLPPLSVPGAATGGLLSLPRR